METEVVPVIMWAPFLRICIATLKVVVVVQVSTFQKSTLFGRANILRKLLSVGGHCLDGEKNL